MASTQQSAVDYIRNGRSVLLNGLQNLNLILHTLRQRKLLSDSEEDFVLGKDKTTINQIGRLLDLAANKGENVCYELLRILDITRYETFPMPVEQHPELHHWISCFPFANDPNIQTDDSAGSGPCSKYEKQLKMKATEILHEKWKQSMNVLKHKAKEKSFKYIPLVLNNDVSVMPHTKIKGYKKKNRTKKLKTYIPTDKRRLSPHDLLISKEKIILLVGKPGIGKTTVVQEILRIWAHGEHSQVSYMFYFDEPLIRFLSQSTKSEPLSCFLFNKYLKPEEDDDTVWKDIEENSENVVIIFDGIMNFVTGSVIEKIMKKEILNDAKILITCRPEADDAGDLSDWTSFRVEVQGFSETSIRAYFQWMLGINDKQMTNISALNNLQLLSLCHVPMYAFIVTACILLSPSEADYQPCTITELYVHIFLHCIALHRDRKMENLDEYIKDRKDNILFLASSSYKALMSKTVNLAEISKTDTVLHGFLTQVTLEGSSSSSQTAFVFLHNTMQEFWSALYLLMTPHEIGELLKQSQKEEGTYLKYVVIFLCGLLSQKTEASLKSLVIPDEIRLISTKYFQDIMNAFLYSGEEDDPNADVEVENVLYVCQCLYEYQTPEACRSFLQKVEYTLDLNDQPLDPHQCCALSYVISKSSSQTIQLNLMNCTIADTGIKLILGSLTNLKSLRLSSSSMQSQIWRVALQESETDFESLLRLFGFEMHLSEQDQRDMNMFHSASNIVLNGRRQNKVKLCLHLDTKKNVANSLLKNIYGSLHNIAEIRIITPDYPRRSSDAWNSAVDSFHLDLFLQGALYEMETRQMCVQQLLSINKHLCSRSPSEQSSFISTLYLHAKQMGILEKLKPVFQAWPTYWVLDLSQRNTFYLVELLKLQGVKQRVELLLSQEEYELKIFLQCLPYVAQVRFNDYIYIQEDDTKAAIKLLVDLFICASESGDDKSLKMLSTVCCYSTFPFAVDMGEIQSDFLLDLYSYVREYESQTGKSVLPALMPIYQTAPAVWVLDLSKGVTSLLHLTMQLQAVKKPVELLGTSNKTDLAHFLQCLPCVVQLRLEELLDRYGSCRQDAANVVLDLFRCAVEEGEATLRMLCSVCSYPTFPFADDAGESQSAFLLDLHSKVKAYEFQTGKSVLPALMPIYQTAPAVWVLDLSKGVMSLLHLTMQLQAVKKPVELRGWSYDTTSLKCFLQCLPFVSQLRFNYLSLILENNIRGAVKLLVELFILASEDGGEILKSLLLVCCYTTFPFADGTGEIQSGFLLDLYSYVREYESQTGKSVLPALMPIYQTAPAVWVLDLSKGVTSLLHLTMQLQSVKRPVELRGWSIDESELKNIVECAPHMSQLTCSERFFQTLCEVLSAVQNWNPEKVAGLLKPLNFSVTLKQMLPRRICKTVGRVLSRTSPEKSLSVCLIPESVSCQGINVLFSELNRFQKLRLNEYAALKVSKMVRLMSQRSVTIEDLSLEPNDPCSKERRICNLIGSLASILRVWTVRCLDLSEIHVEGQFLISLMCLDRPFSVRMSDETMKQLVEIVSEAQDDNLTRSFLEKVGGDLSSSSLPWNKLQYLLQTSNIPLTLDSRKNRFATINMQDLLELLHRIHLSETNSQFVKNALKEIYASRAGHLVTSLLKTSGNWIHLSDQELDRYDCSALRFALHYSDDVRLDLSGATIPKEETKSILLLMPRVSHLRVDRHLLVELLHVCSVSREKRVATSLMMALQKKLDFSQPSAVGLLEQGSREPMVLSIKDCQSISSAIQLSDCDTDLIMLDCQAEDCALEQLFPALSHMRLRLDKPHLLQLILLTRCVEKADSWNRTKALSRALGKEIDLSHTSLDCHSCESLGLVLEHSEDLTHLNLSHCQLTDGCLELLLPHLHKVLLLDLSNNDITDHGAQRLQTVLTSTQTVRIFNNFITDMRLFIKNLHYQETLHNTPTCVQAEEENISKSLVTKDPECVFVAKAPFEILTKRITTVAMFDPDIYIHDDHIMYRFQCEIGGDFQCRSTQLIFGMKGSGFVEYKVINWDIHCFSKHSYKPAGPLYEIKTLKGEIYQLYLPHCETEADSLGDISVAHMHDGSMQILAPVNLTCTHVGVHINGLSSYGTVHRKGSMTRSVRGQVLLFLEQINKKEKRLWVFLLSRTVSHREIKRQQQGYTPIKTSSDCILTQKGKYCLTSNLKHCKVQPKTYTFQAAGDADHHAAFELFIGNEVSELQVKLQEKGKQLRTRWNRRVILNVNDNHANKIKTEEGAKMEENVLLTEKDWKTSLCNLLEDLSKKQLKKLRHLMTNTTNLVHIPRGKLEKKNKLDLIDIMIEAWGFQGSVYAVKDFMKRLPRNDDAVNCMLNPYLKQFGL